MEILIPIRDQGVEFNFHCKNSGYYKVFLIKNFLLMQAQIVAEKEQASLRDGKGPPGQDVKTVLEGAAALLSAKTITMTLKEDIVLMAQTRFKKKLKSY